MSHPHVGEPQPHTEEAGEETINTTSVIERNRSHLTCVWSSCVKRVLLGFIVWCSDLHTLSRITHCWFVPTGSGDILNRLYFFYYLYFIFYFFCFTSFTSTFTFFYFLLLLLLLSFTFTFTFTSSSSTFTSSTFTFTSSSTFTFTPSSASFSCFTAMFNLFTTVFSGRLFILWGQLWQNDQIKAPTASLAAANLAIYTTRRDRLQTGPKAEPHWSEAEVGVRLPQGHR